jgi:hypothetical protein
MKFGTRRISAVQLIASIALMIILWGMLFLVFDREWIKNEGKEIVEFRCNMVEVEKEVEQNQYFTRVQYWMSLHGSPIRRRFWPHEIYLIEDKFVQYTLAQCLWKTGIIQDNILYNQKDLNLDEIYEVTNPIIFVMTDEDRKKSSEWEKSQIPELSSVYPDPKYIDKWYEIGTGDVKERLKAIKWRQCEEFYKPCFVSLRNGQLDVKVWQVGDRKIYQIPYLSEADFTWKFLMEVEGEDSKYLEFTAQVKNDETRKDLLIMLEGIKVTSEK